MATQRPRRRWHKVQPTTWVHRPVRSAIKNNGKPGKGHTTTSLCNRRTRYSVTQCGYTLAVALNDSGQSDEVVDKLGVRENTIFIWMSENGPEEIYPHHRTSGPWRGTYFTALEGSLRTPFLIRWPGNIEAGSKHNEIMHITDLYPTLARIAGADVPEYRIIDGVDQVDF